MKTLLSPLVICLCLASGLCINRATASESNTGNQQSTAAKPSIIVKKVVLQYLPPPPITEPAPTPPPPPAALTSSPKGSAADEIAASGAPMVTTPDGKPAVYDYDPASGSLRISAAPEGFTVQPPAARQALPPSMKTIPLQTRVVTSDGIELEGAIATFAPSGTIVHVAEGGVLDMTARKTDDETVFVIHPGYELFEGTISSSNNLVVRSIKDAASAERFAALPELQKILETCRPKTIEQIKEADKDADGDDDDDAPAKQSSTMAAMMSGDLVMKLNVLPNPAQDQVAVQYTLSAESKVMIELFRMENGQRVVLQDFGTKPAGTNEVTLPLSGLSSGTYMVLLRSSSCQYAMSKFVKQ